MKCIPIATASENLWVNAQLVTMSQLETIKEEVNKQVTMNVSYSKRSKLKIAF